MGFSDVIWRAERIREDCPDTGLSIRGGQCDGQRGEKKSSEQTSRSRAAGKHRGGSPGVYPWWIFPQSWKISRHSTVLYPALHQSPMKPVGSVWSLIQRESSAKPCSPRRCDKWQGATAVLRDDRAVLCIQTAPGALISSDKWKALRNVSCPLKIHQEISLNLNTIWGGLLIPEFSLKIWVLNGWKVHCRKVTKMAWQ